ncbi:MAG: RluA family pseudouridine synthase [Proteobacteria bacterium]|nr:RluA family pseudouridine synthase [Pseudomonadota bacterium]
MDDLDLYSNASQHHAEDGEEGSRLIEVDDDADGERLDVFVSRATRISRTHIQDLLTDGHVRYLGPRNLSKLKAGLKVQSGDQFSVTPPAVQPLDDVQPEDIPLDIVYEDADLLVINKARGMVVHPAPGSERGTLVNALLHHVRDLSGIAGIGRPGIVHRLDKDTSGLIVVAKNDNAHSELSRQFGSRLVKKIYVALVHGSAASESTIDMPIGRHPVDRKRMAVVYSGRPAVTEFRKVESLDGYSLLDVRIKTGRTHQIRVHLSWLGFPIVGDPLYCRRDPLALNGQFLHARHLSFTHPTHGHVLTFDQPLPAALAECLERVRSGQVPPGEAESPLQSFDGWPEAASGAL